MKVTLVTKTVGVDKYEALDSEEIIAAIARHGIIKDDNGKLVKYLMTMNHWSPLDMINFGFEVETSRAIGRHILRHWSIKPQELSERYQEMVSIEPIELRWEHPTNRQSSTTPIATININDQNINFVNNNISTALYDEILKISKLSTELIESYHNLVKFGVAKETARMILPEATTSTLTLNGSLRSWLSFLNVRMEKTAQKEIQQIAVLIGNELEQLMPHIFDRIDWKHGLFMNNKN